MSFRLFSICMICAGILSATGCEEHEPVHNGECIQAIAKNEWCDARQVGFVAGVPIKSRLLFDCLDAHGHELVHEQIKCPTCRAAIPSGGFCDKCRIGWFKGMAYFSRLTYHTARGRTVLASDLTCDGCRRGWGATVWCDRCKRGIVGNVVLDNRADFDGARRGFEIMLLAIEASDRCETCAMAIVADDSCFFCKTAYRDGRPMTVARN